MKFFLLLFSLLVLSPNALASFRDVPVSHEYSAAIGFLEREGMVKGYADDTFKPENEINRAEFTKIIIEAAYSSQQIDACDWQNWQITDVKISDWYAKYVCMAYVNDIVSGYPDGTFRGAQSINYAESAKILTETFNLPLGPQGEAWYTPYVGAILQAGATPRPYITSDAKITRGEMAQMMYQILNTENKCVTFDDFTTDNQRRWRMVNDNVMGGRSLGDFAIENYTLLLFGSTNTNGGGFSSIRAPLSDGVLTAYDTIKLRAKSDGRGYQITFRDNNWQGVSHRTSLDFTTTNQWEELSIPFSTLTPAFFGRTVAADPFRKQNAREIGIIINDGQDGAFDLQIDAIELCKNM